MADLTQITPTKRRGFFVRQDIALVRNVSLTKADLHRHVMSLGKGAPFMLLGVLAVLCLWMGLEVIVNNWATSWATVMTRVGFLAVLAAAGAAALGQVLGDEIMLDADKRKDSASLLKSPLPVAQVLN